MRSFSADLLSSASSEVIWITSLTFMFSLLALPAMAAMCCDLSCLPLWIFWSMS